MGRKASLDSALMFFFNLVIFALALGVMLTSSSTMVNSPIVAMNYVVTDLALLIDIAYASPANLVVPYFVPNIAEEYDFTIEPDITDTASNILMGSNEMTVKTARYPISLDLWLTSNKLRGSSDMKSRIFLSKTGIDFSIGNLGQISEDIDNNKLFYFDQDTKINANWITKKKIVLDPGNYDQDPGHTAEVVEYEVTQDIVSVLQAPIPNANKVVLNQIPVSERLSKIPPADLLISIHVGNYPDKEFNPVKVYIPDYSLESRKLGSVIANTLITELGFSAASIVPVDVGRLSVNDPRKVLRRDFPSVLLEVGNIQSDRFSDSQKIAEVANTIKKGIDKYYLASPANNLAVRIRSEEIQDTDIMDQENPNSDSFTVLLG